MLKVFLVLTMTFWSYGALAAGSGNNDNPMADKTFGVEINPLRPLGIGEDGDENIVTFSGTVSLFNLDRRAEIAFPLFYGKTKDRSEDEFLETITVDAHYRYFLSGVQNGFYLAGFSRLAFLNGTLGDDLDINDVDANGDNVVDRTTKFGLGGGIGYRYFSSDHLYWGASLSFGRYLVGENDRYVGELLGYDDDAQDIVDVEFAKVGWAF